MDKTRHKGILRIASDKYLVRVKATNPRTGKQEDVKRRVEGKIADALAERNKIREQIESGRRLERVTLRTYARSWLRTRLPSLKPSTRKSYADALELHILPELGDHYLDTITPSDVRAYVADKSESLGAWTVGRQLRTLRTIARDAMADGYVRGYFCDRVKAPTPPEYTEDDPNLLTAEEMRELLAALPPQWLPAALVAATTGLRWGEISGLKWSDVDEAAGVIRVRRSNWKGIATGPKTRKSRRVVPLLPEVAESLRAHRRRLLEAQNPGLAEGWIFPTRRGTLHRGTPFRKVLQKACKAAGIDRRFTFHGLRRTFNNLAVPLAPRKVLQDIMGHVTDAMTDHYSITRSEEKAQLSAGVYDLIRRSESGTSGGTSQAEESAGES